jgi:hypothetical protein
MSRGTPKNSVPRQLHATNATRARSATVRKPTLSPATNRQSTMARTRPHSPPSALRLKTTEHASGHSDSADHFDPIHAETKSPTRSTGAESPSRSPCLDMRSLRRQERLDNTTAGATGAADNHICRRRATTSNDAAHAFAYRDRATSETHPDDTKRELMRNRQTQAAPLVMASIMLLKSESIGRAAILAFGPKTH